MSKKLSLSSLPVLGKKVLIRVDFNVPLNKEGKIIDDSRIVASLPSIQYVLENGGSLILMSHLGRPKEKSSPEFSLAPCAKQLEKLLGKKVLMASDCVGQEVQQLAKNLQPGQLLMLENLRFHRAEEHPEEDPTFSQQLASLADLYVNDAFGTAHRAHASTATVAQYFPGKAAAGFLLEKEINFLGTLLQNPPRPFYAIIGGAKISTKIGVIQSLLKKVDGLLIGGAMAYTFFKAQGLEIGDSLYEESFLEKAKELLKENQTAKVKFLLPQDSVVADKFSNEANSQTVVSKNGFPLGFQGMDIGQKTTEQFVEELQKAKTVFWNGPLGVFEFSNFAKGTNAIAKAIANLSATTVVGGGESIAAIQVAGVADKISHLSTGGGASLEYLEFGTLPGIEALSDL